MTMKNIDPNQLSVASAKGNALASAWVQHSAVDGIISLLDSVVQGGVTANSTGATLNSPVSVDQAAQMMAILSNLTERESSVRTTVALITGDLLIDLERSLGQSEYEELLSQVVSEQGREKHTVREYKRTCEWLRDVFPDGDRPDNLSYTHWNEFKSKTRRRDGSQAIPNDKVRELVSTVSQGVVINAGELADGTPFEQRRPLTCAETRSLLREARGDTTNPPPIPADTSDHSSELPRYLSILSNWRGICSAGFTNNPTPSPTEGVDTLAVVDLQEEIITLSNGDVIKIIDLDSK